MGWSCSDDSGTEEERAGGGAGPAGGGQEQEDWGRVRAYDVYLEYWRSSHLSDDGGDTLRASGHCMYMHMHRHDPAEVVFTILRQSDFKVMP